jgi:hypothetical protein
MRERPAAGTPRQAGSTSTLLVRRADDWHGRAGWLGIGRTWEVSDGGTVVARARTHWNSYTVDIDAGGRQLTMHMAGKHKWRSPSRLHVAEARSGRPLITGRHLSGGRGANNLIGEKWEVSLASGATVSWFYWQRKHMLGFYDGDENPVMLVGHDPSFDAPSRPTLLRILLRFWMAAAASMNRYTARIGTSAVGRLVPAPDVPVLAFLGVWLERTAGLRYPSSA